ncbi:transcriptional regulator, IclR family [Haloechinothrix alba]|uniref:Transcriptional regulator, IclR family n=1 Tax=Haloechinothrix alba TaxID=664784 RepID=A0A238WRR7_9PSEU|nr:helix-turn-helix domain-containing protein [Haloechinothrix alba]SNR49098.1 transcriptional regulator, IclR family [Haloechinothrix alba]
MNQLTPDVNAAGAAYSRTLGNGLRVLELLHHNPAGLGVAAIASALDLHRTVVYRLLGTLRAHELVVTTGDGRYQLGTGLVELAGTVRADLRSAAEPHLTRLAADTAATAFLAVADRHEAVGICVVEPPHAQLHVSYRLGTRHPLTVSAAGVAILAGRPPVPGERDEVTRARQRGYAVTAGELQQGAWGLATALPAADGPAEASVGVVALSELDTPATAEAVRAAAEAIAGSSAARSLDTRIGYSVYCP